MRISGLYVAVVSLYYRSTTLNNKEVLPGIAISHQCWETAIGQSIYRLFLIDTIAAVGTTLV